MKVALSKERTILSGLACDDFERVCGDFLAARSAPAYRVRQLREWVFQRKVGDFEQMSDLPKDLRRDLSEAFLLHPLEVVERLKSKDGTQKILWRSLNGGQLESVIIPDGKRTTYCISTQAGCPVKCTFCATGYGGFRGQLSAAEIVTQVLAMENLTESPPTNIVFMGMGEPLLNFEPLLRSLEILTHHDQLDFGMRRITVSTVGIPTRIRELGERFPQVKIALSLHAARDALRNEIIPLNETYPLADVLGALADVTRSSGKKVTFEYILLPGVNDARRDARDVARVANALPCRINLIGYNPFPGGIYRKPSVRRILTFRDWLRAETRAEVTVRRSRGEDIQGACGQLSLKEERGSQQATAEQSVEEVLRGEI